MTATALAPLRFVRRTRLSADEYRKNFRQIDADIISAVTSAEADRVTPLMSKVYLRLASAPAAFWEADGVLYFGAGEVDGRTIKASKVLYELLGVASATAHKALRWMHGQGIIGYSSGKNGAGIRIFLNRAASSIGVRGEQPGKKILPFARGSNGAGHGSAVEPAFKDSFAVQRDFLDESINPRAPKNGADTGSVVNTVSDPEPSAHEIPRPSSGHEGREVGTAAASSAAVNVWELVMRLRSELEPSINRAAARAAERELAETRRWFEERALPKAVRVAQRETYDLLRKHGTIDERPRHARAGLEVGRAAPESCAQTAPRALTPEEVRETAETCVALLETQGTPIEATLADISAEGGGWLLPEDAPRVREKVQALLLGRSDKR